MIRLAWALAALAFAACVTDGEPPEGYSAAQARWRAKEPARYSYTVSLFCECSGGPYRVTASRDSVISAESVNKADLGGPANPQSLSIENLLADIDDLAKRHPAVLKAHFDATYGYPDTVAYDGSRQIADDEFTRIITDFRVEETP